MSNITEITTKSKMVACEHFTGTAKQADIKALELSKYWGEYYTAVLDERGWYYKITNQFDPHIRMANQLGFHTKFLPKIANFSKCMTSESPKQRIQHLLIHALRVSSNTLMAVSRDYNELQYLLSQEYPSFSAKFRVAGLLDYDKEIKDIKMKQSTLILGILADMKKHTENYKQKESNHDKNG